MKIKLLITWDSVRSSYWFVPCLMVGGAVLLSAATIALDSALPTSTRRATWLYSGGAEGARTLLATLAASMITIFGVVFSIVIVALTLASSQFGPRLLRTFLRDTVDQVAVGTFISTFVYCVLVLRTVRASGSEPFAPDISVTTAILLALFSLGVLIYFIDHLSASLQASHIIAAVGADLDATIDCEFAAPSERTEDESTTTDAGDAFASATIAIRASRCGYIQAVDYDALVRIAKRNESMFRIVPRTGDFVARGDTLVFVSSESDAPEQLANSINTAFVLGVDRTDEQDVEFPINQLVQLAARSLSPAINDPITAIMAIEQLRAELCRIAERVAVSPVLRDSQGVARLLVAQQTSDHIAEASFSLLRQFGRSNLEVTMSLLNAIEQIARRTTDASFRGELLRQATLIEHGARSGLPIEADRQVVAARCGRITERSGRFQP